MAREPRPVAGLMDTNVPSQLDEEDLAAEIEVELPGSMDNDVMEMVSEEIPEDIEIYEEGENTVVDFDPQEDTMDLGDFYGNLAEGMSDSELGALSGNLLDEY